MPMAGSTVVRRQLGRQLRKLRDKAGKSDRDVEESSLASRTKLWRIETGKTAVRIADVRALCWLYNADPTTTESLVRLAQGTNTQNWWEERFADLPGWFWLYLGLESTATSVCVYDPELVFGLLQSRRYMEAI